MMLAPYATHPDRSRGRLVKEKECLTRSVFQRDRDRIIHSAAFRRLEYKTQVFINHEGDHYRTRLTHSIEVGQLARGLCRNLKLNEDIGEAIALAHDLGHTPFGHAGEDGLREVMEPYGGFDHNAQAIRILTRLEQRYALFDGLNLTWETLEGIAKHNGPVTGALPEALAEYDALNPLELHTYAGAEAQIASIADDIAYHNHDMEDGIRAHFFTLDELRFVPLMDATIKEVDHLYHSLPEQRRTHEVIRRMIAHMMQDILQQTADNIRHSSVHHVEDIRQLGKPLVAFSPAMQETQRALKEFLMQRMYKHYRVNRMTSKARRIISELFLFFFKEPECLPTEWQELAISAPHEKAKARIVCDFIAGMTDRFALNEYQKLFDAWEKT